MPDVLPQPVALVPPLVAAPVPWRTRIGRAPPTACRVSSRLLLALRQAARRGPLCSLLSLSAALLVGAAVLTHTDLDHSGAALRFQAPATPGTAQPPAAPVAAPAPVPARARTQAATPAHITPDARLTGMATAEAAETDGPLTIYLVASQAEADELARRLLLEPLPDQPRLQALVVGTERVDGNTHAARLIGAVATDELAQGQSPPRVIDGRTARPASGDTSGTATP